jgi:hypothetical protein
VAGSPMAARQLSVMLESRTVAPMTGGEIIAATAASKAAAKALAVDETTKGVLLRLAEDTPEMQAAARNRAARINALERAKLKLYQPICRLFGVPHEYFEDTFLKEIGAKTADIPDENFRTPSPAVAVPAFQGLSYTYEEPDLKEMYLNLIATASDDRRAEEAHPAFAQFIKELAPREAKLLPMLLVNSITPTVRVKDEVAFNAFTVLLPHLLPHLSDSGEPEEESQLPTWVDNWSRLGLVNVVYVLESVKDDGAYAWVESRPEYMRLAAKPGVTRIGYDKGVIRPTSLGLQFLYAVAE